MLAVRPTRNPEAYDHYLRGNRLLWREVETSVLPGVGEYQAALKLDPSFTAARGRLSYAYGLALNLSLWPDALQAQSVLTLGAAAAERAIGEDSTVSDAWLGRGLVLFFGGRREDVSNSLESLRRAVQLNPGNDAAHHWYAVVLRRLGRFVEAEQEYHRALVINPQRLVTMGDLAFLNYSLRRYAEARSWYDSTLALDPTMSSTNGFQARVRVELGDLAGALRDAETFLRVATQSSRPRAAALLAEMEARGGDLVRGRDRLEGVFNELGWRNGVPTSTISVRNAYDPALAALSLGERDVTLGILEHATPRGPWLWSYLIFPGFDSLRTDPRFIKIFDESRPPGAPEVPR